MIPEKFIQHLISLFHSAPRSLNGELRKLGLFMLCQLPLCYDDTVTLGGGLLCHSELYSLS